MTTFPMTRFIHNQMQTYIAKNQNTILLNDRQRNRHASKQDK